MKKPVRIQRKRTKGWRMPPNTVYVGRGSAWGNPFVIGVDGDAATCVKRYARMLMPYTHQKPDNTLRDFYVSEANMEEIQRTLRGKNLPCWCALNQPCHADFLLEIANEKPRGRK